MREHILAKKLALVVALTFAAALGLRFLDTYLSLALTLPFVFAATVVHHALFTWISPAMRTPFAPVTFGGEIQLASSKDHRVRRIEDDLFRSIVTGHQSSRAALSYLHDIREHLESHAVRLGEELHLSDRTREILDRAHDSTPPELSRSQLATIIRELDGQRRRLSATGVR